jgi:hypothetical protein
MKNKRKTTVVFVIKKKKRLRPDFVFLRYHLVVGDLNNDRKLDFAVTKEDTDN